MEITFRSNFKIRKFYHNFSLGAISGHLKFITNWHYGCSIDLGSNSINACVKQFAGISTRFDEKAILQIQFPVNTLNHADMNIAVNLPDRQKRNKTWFKIVFVQTRHWKHHMRNNRSHSHDNWNHEEKFFGGWILFTVIKLLPLCEPPSISLVLCLIGAPLLPMQNQVG